MTCFDDILLRTGRRWELLANSSERLDALVGPVHAEGGAAREVSRRIARVGGEPPGARRRRPDAHPGRGHLRRFRRAHRSASRPRRPGEVHAADLARRPNMLGLTPRQAAAEGVGAARVELEAALAAIEWRNTRLRRAGHEATMDVAWLRSELGFPPDPSSRG